MRMTALVLVLAALVSAWALSRPQPGQMPHPGVAMAQAGVTHPSSTTPTDPPAAATKPARGPGGLSSPAAELGTMLLASLGLLALGLALRQRRRH